MKLSISKFQRIRHWEWVNRIIASRTLSSMWLFFHVGIKVLFRTFAWGQRRQKCVWYDKICVNCVHYCCIFVNSFHTVNSFSSLIVAKYGEKKFTHNPFMHCRWHRIHQLYSRKNTNINKLQAIKMHIGSSKKNLTDAFFTKLWYHSH